MDILARLFLSDTYGGMLRYYIKGSKVAIDGALDTICFSIHRKATFTAE